MYAWATIGLADTARGGEAVRAIIDDLARERIDRRGALTAGIAAGLSLTSLSALAESVPGRALPPTCGSSLRARFCAASGLLRAFRSLPHAANRRIIGLTGGGKRDLPAEHR
jgi:hypothetical protein